MAVIRILHLVGSPTSKKHFELSMLYASGCINALHQPEKYAFSIALVGPDGLWRFPDSLDKSVVDAAQPHAFHAAMGVLAKAQIDVALPQMFCLAGMTTYQIGIFAIFGGFMMGVLLHTERAFVDSWNDRVGSFVSVFFLPVFFTLTGLRTDIGALSGGSAWGWCALLIGLATVGKFGGCWIAARACGLSAVQSRIVAILMNTRGLMELVIINVGYELGIIGREVFTMLVLMAVFSTVITTPLLRRWQSDVSAVPVAQPHVRS